MHCEKTKFGFVTENIVMMRQNGSFATLVTDAETPLYNRIS
jgi:hypothetical protein